MYIASKDITVSTSLASKGVLVSFFHASICSYVIGLGPLNPILLVLLKAIKADHTWEMTIGKSGDSNPSGLMPVCFSTCSRCSLSDTPSLPDLLKENVCSA